MLYCFLMDKETLKYVLTQYTSKPLPRTTARTIELPLDSRKVVTLVGIRRSGKTLSDLRDERASLEAMKVFVSESFTTKR